MTNFDQWLRLNLDRFGKMFKAYGKSYLTSPALLEWGGTITTKRDLREVLEKYDRLKAAGVEEFRKAVVVGTRENGAIHAPVESVRYASKQLKHRKDIKNKDLLKFELCPNTGIGVASRVRVIETGELIDTTNYDLW